ncbi:hypothetical protein MCC01970_16380 [Bifidobacteriaceae bacterium MCC01970]|nr:hypothetical protein MCC01970_16380 [Bifidobacteriaceae bacterium MCC01970]
MVAQTADGERSYVWNSTAAQLIAGKVDEMAPSMRLRRCGVTYRSHIMLS